MQTGTSITIAAPPVPWDPEELQQRTAGWRGWASPAISVGVLLTALIQLRMLDLGHLWAMLPVRPVFWLALSGTYLALPVSEWLIYRRLWSLPLSGLIPLLRKRISNEILLGYSGEFYFYVWARRRTRLTAAPFGVIKDVSVLSAQVGNLVTLAMLGLAWPVLGTLQLGQYGRALLLSGMLVVAMSLPAMLFRRRLFTLAPSELWRISALHLVRIAASLLCTALAWHEALPAVALSWWVVLAAMRQLLSRLPLMPNKDIVFAGFIAYVIGTRGNLADVVAITGSIVLLTHLCLGITLALADLLTPPAEPAR